MRISSKLTVFALMLNGWASVLASAGVAEDLGVSWAPGGNGEIQAMETAAKSISPGGGGIGETLFALYNAMAGTFVTIFEVVFAGPLMLMNVGVPAWIVQPFGAILVFIWAIDIAYILSGRDI